MPGSDKTENLPPIKSLCSIKNKLFFFAISLRALSFFSEIIIIFFLFFLIIFKKIKFVKVSVVFPDFEIMRKRMLSKFSFFLKLFIFSSSKSSKKKNFFFYLIF